MWDGTPREKVQLYLLQYREKAWQFADLPHPPLESLTIRPSRIQGLYALFDPPPGHAAHWCLVDTGAMLTLIPREVWEPHQDQIRWLATTDGSLTHTTIGNRSVSFRLGLVTVHF